LEQEITEATEFLEYCFRNHPLQWRVLIFVKQHRFVMDNAQAIASARPALPAGLNDRAADIWAIGHWPETARKAAVNLSVTTQDRIQSGHCGWT
jgi:hypothetical protein